MREPVRDRDDVLVLCRARNDAREVTDGVVGIAEFACELISISFSWKTSSGVAGGCASGNAQSRGSVVLDVCSCRVKNAESVSSFFEG